MPNIAACLAFIVAPVSGFVRPTVEFAKPLPAALVLKFLASPVLTVFARSLYDSRFKERRALLASAKSFALVIVLPVYGSKSPIFGIVRPLVAFLPVCCLYIALAAMAP